jgi:hypothetical protein
VPTRRLGSAEQVPGIAGEAGGVERDAGNVPSSVVIEVGHDVRVAIQRS